MDINFSRNNFTKNNYGMRDMTIYTTQQHIMQKVIKDNNIKTSHELNIFLHKNKISKMKEYMI